ncbi:MAG: glycosyltransferase family 39 protein [Desulfobacterales bacterium]
MTHSVIVAVLSSTTLLQTIRIQRNPTKLNYAILGLFVGMGLLSKYNYALFLAALLVTLAFTSQYRPVIMRYRVVFSFLIAAVIIIPHIIWLFSNMNIATGIVHKLNMGTGNAVVGIGHALFNALAFLGPLLIASVFLFGGNARPNIAQRDDKLFLLHLFIVVFGIVSIFVLVTGAQEIKDRWYQPLLFFSPLLLALYAKPSPRAYRIYCIVGVTLALIAAIVLPFRTLLAGNLGYIKRPNIPYARLASDLMQLTRNPTTIVAESRLIGGNMRLAFPLSRIITPEYKEQVQLPDGIWLVLCETQNCQEAAFRTWIYSQYSIEVTSLNFKKFKQPYYYAPEREHVLYGAKVTAHQR